MSTAIRNEVRVLVVDDHPLVRDGVAFVLSASGAARAVGQAGTAREALERFARDPPDVTILDLTLPDLSGLDLLKRLRELQPAARVLVFTVCGAVEDVRRALQAGASGYVLKTTAGNELVAAVQALKRGERYVSPCLLQSLDGRPPECEPTVREMDVLRLLAQGAHDKEIAGELGIGVGTVRMHVNSLMGKFAASSRGKVVATALRLGFIHLPQL